MVSIFIYVVTTAFLHVMKTSYDVNEYTVSEELLALSTSATCLLLAGKIFENVVNALIFNLFYLIHLEFT